MSDWFLNSEYTIYLISLRPCISSSFFLLLSLPIYFHIFYSFFPLVIDNANLCVCNQGGRKQLIPSLLPIVIQSNVHIICKLLCLCLPHVPTLYRMFIFLLQYNLSKPYIYSFRGWKSVNVVRKRPEARTIIPPTHPVYVCLQHHMRPL